MEKCYETIEVGDKNGENNEKWLEGKGRKNKTGGKMKNEISPSVKRERIFTMGRGPISRFQLSPVMSR